MEWEGKEIKKKVIKVLITAFIGVTALFFWQWGKFYDDRLHLIFCDVGQGDAILIRKNTKEILIDGGPDKKVLSCLSNNMPFWDRKIEVVILTHPQADHLNGLIFVVERYAVDDFIASPVGNTSLGFKKLKDLIYEKGIPVENLFSGGKISFASLKLASLWPKKEWLMAHLSQEELSKNIYGGAVLGAKTNTDLNDFSLVFHLKYGGFDALLTGDADQRVQDEIMSFSQIPKVEVLKVPHHGSKTALKDDFLEAANPELVVISVGKNSWGHPAKEIIWQLSERAIRILTTDKKGEIEIVSDGKSWRVL